MGWAEHRDHDGKWRARWRNRHGSKDATDYRFRTEAAAKRHADKIEKTEKEERKKLKAELKRKPAGADPGQTFKAFVNEWFAAQQVDRNSLRNYRSIIQNHLLPKWGARTLAELEAADHQITIWYGFLEKHYAHNTVNGIASLFSTIMKDAAKIHINRNPAERQRNRGAIAPRKLARMAEKKEHEQLPNPVQALITAERVAILSERDADFIMVVTKFFTGVRWSELIALRPPAGGVLSVDRQLYFEGPGFCCKPPKAGSYRSIGVPPFLLDMFATLPKRTLTGRLCPCGEDLKNADGLADGGRHPEGDTLFDSPTPTKPHWRDSWFSSSYFLPAFRGRSTRAGRRPVAVHLRDTDPDPLLGQPYRKYSKSATACWSGFVPEGTLHTCRHWHRTLLSDLGVPNAVANERMGHTDSSIAAVYTHPTDRSRGRLLEDLEDVWWDMVAERKKISRSSQVPLLDRMLRAS
jgi:site-specific recombinase XerD